MKVKWLLGYLKIPAAYFIIFYSYIHFWFWYSASILDNEPAQAFDFIIGKKSDHLNACWTCCAGLQY